MCNGSHQHPQPSRGSAWQNLTSGDIPLPSRLRQLVANTWWKVRRRQSCCGHYGAPGC
jgi:hypothetical protein